MSKLEKLIAEDAAIDKAEHRLRVRKNKFLKKLKEHEGEIAIVDGVIYQVHAIDKPFIVKVGDVPCQTLN
jgi:hypothetical protein